MVAGRLAAQDIGAATFLPTTFTIIATFLSNSDWKYRCAVVPARPCVIVGCHERAIAGCHESVAVDAPPPWLRLRMHRHAALVALSEFTHLLPDDMEKLLKVCDQIIPFTAVRARVSCKARPPRPLLTPPPHTHTPCAAATCCAVWVCVSVLLCRPRTPTSASNTPH